MVAGLRSGARVGPGTRLNGVFEIDELIAVGGMGHVYRGRALETGDKVAIKMIRPELAQDETYLALFRKEASVLHRTPHDAVVRYYIFTTDPDLHCPYLAMEFVEGFSLSTLYKRNPLDLADVRILQRRLGSGLEAAHRLGVIHRDVSPDNIILPQGDPRQCKLIDFGIARDTYSASTLIGTDFAGKSNFASPEQIGLYAGAVTAKSDIYALGLTLAAALLGRPIDMSGTPADLVLKRQKVPDLSSIPADFRPLLEHMLQPNPDDRPDSMAHVAAWPDKPGATQMPRIMPAQAPAAPVEAAPVAPASRPHWLMPALVAGLVGLAVGAAGIVGWSALTGAKKPPEVVASSTPQAAPEPPAAVPPPPRLDNPPSPSPVVGEPPRSAATSPMVPDPAITPTRPAPSPSPPPPAPEAAPPPVATAPPAAVEPPPAGTAATPERPVVAVSPDSAPAGADLKPSAMPDRPVDPAAFRDCSDCPELLAVPAGIFMMGGTDASEKPVHRVPVTGFSIGRFPVTVAEWRACVRAKGCGFDPGGDPQAPVHNVSWDDAQQYVTWLSRTTGKSYRLPSEAEWEYAARARSVTRYWWGNEFEQDMADCHNCGGVASPRNPPKIAMHPANGFGLHDVLGSVSQWVEDCWHKDYRGAPTSASAWTVPRCGQRVLRGGSWTSAPADLRTGSREFYDQGVRYPGHGLRVARDP